ncbi:uncharacterized protein PAC_14720 [Phialocephala subalpina]|uniref:Uncharacterized protein n=1 Tax=Phialocephala subalpina TaxID=576137 RepID=A0A1L7XIG9_9HELO|nr:uncharacterized protein PAC_14720 [Phialocephala subalpina]
MCGKNRSRRGGGCHGRRWNNNNNLPLAPGQAPVVGYERRPGLFGMIAQQMAQKRDAKQQQQNMTYDQKPMYAQREEVFELEKMVEERKAQQYWDDKNAERMGMNASVGQARVGQGVDHVDVRQSWMQNENNRLSRVSVGTELPSYGQAMKQ